MNNKSVKGNMISGNPAKELIIPLGASTTTLIIHTFLLR